MATCFDSIESSLGLPKNRFNVSKFMVHFNTLALFFGRPGRLKAFGIPKCTINFDTLDHFFGRPDNDLTESKHVAIRTFYVINCCV
jgi:hypothetical protein